MAPLKSRMAPFGIEAVFGNESVLIALSNTTESKCRCRWLRDQSRSPSHTERTMSPKPAVPPVSKCGKTTKLILTIARLGEKPGMKVFQCSACKYLTWTKTLEKA